MFVYRQKLEKAEREKQEYKELTERQEARVSHVVFICLCSVQNTRNDVVFISFRFPELCSE
jgi:hypothetical protein